MKEEKAKEANDEGLKKAKADGFKEFCESLNPNSPFRHSTRKVHTLRPAVQAQSSGDYYNEK